MLGQSRITIRQASELAKSGRFTEAYRLLDEPRVAGHRLAIQLRDRMADQLLARATRRATAEDLAGALDDLRLADQEQVPPDRLAEVRKSLAEPACERVHLLLVEGDAEAALRQFEEYDRHRIPGAGFQKLGRIAQAWTEALHAARAAAFVPAESAFARALRLIDDEARPALQADHRAWTDRVVPLQRALNALAEAQGGPDEGAVLRAAEHVLTLAPDHEPARLALGRPIATREKTPMPTDDPNPRQAADMGVEDEIRFLSSGSGSIGETRETILHIDAQGRMSEVPAPLLNLQAVVDRVGLDARRTESIPRHDPGPRPAPSPTVVGPGPHGRFVLWVDGIGSYLVCLDPSVSLGRATELNQVDIPLLGDLSRHHATIQRVQGHYIFNTEREATINGRPIRGNASLRDRDQIGLGTALQIEFRQPSPASATALLRIRSGHRMPLAVDSVLLMAETCILGATPQAHIVHRELARPLVLFRQAGQLWCRSDVPMHVDGRLSHGRAPLTFQSRVVTKHGSFNLEPLGATPTGGVTSRLT